MVTQTVICVTPSEAAALAAAESWSSREADSIIKKASTPTDDGGNEELMKMHHEKADGFAIDLDLADVPTQQPPIPKSKLTHGNGNNELEETYVELQVGFRTIRVQQRGMRPAPAACTPTPTSTQSTNCSTSSNAYRGEKKLALPPDAQDSIIYEDTAMKNQRIDAAGMVERGSPTHSVFPLLMFTYHKAVVILTGGS